MVNASEVELPPYMERYQTFEHPVASCGYPALDACGFLCPGKVTVVFSPLLEALGGLAKDLVARILLDDLRADGPGVLVFTPRVSATEYLHMLALQEAGVNRFLYERKLMTRAKCAEDSKRYDAVIAKLRTARLGLEDAWAPDPDSMLRIARIAGRQGRLGLVVVDQLQDLDCGGLSAAQAGWGVVGSRLARIASELDAPVLVLSGSPTGEIRLPAAYRGYGCLHGYVDVPLSLTLQSFEEGRAQEHLLLRSIRGRESGVEIVRDMASGRIVSCEPWGRVPEAPVPVPPQQGWSVGS